MEPAPRHAQPRPAPLLDGAMPTLEEVEQLRPVTFEARVLDCGLNYRPAFAILAFAILRERELHESFGYIQNALQCYLTRVRELLLAKSDKDGWGQKLARVTK